MPDSLVLSVILGLVAGIVFIAVFASLFSPPTPVEQSVIIDISDFGLTTYFLFSDLESKVINFEVHFDLPAILMRVDVQQNTELRVRFHEHLFEQLERQQPPEGYPFGDRLTVFVDDVPKDVKWEYIELEAIANIPLEAGAATIEIVPSRMLA